VPIKKYVKRKFVQNEFIPVLLKNIMIPTTERFPPLLEGFGLPVIKVMQFGKPVFSSNRTSLPEICGGHAFLWENFDVDYMIQSHGCPVN
jgi:hypothetical protein